MNFARICALAAMLAFWVAGATTSTAAQRPRSGPTATPVTVYAGVGGIGVFGSTGLNGTWQGPSTLPSDVLSLAGADPAHWRTVYAGLRSGVYVSGDGGVTWAATGLRNRAALALTVDARNPSTIVAGTERGVYRSSDAGATWSQADGISRTVTALVQGPADAGLYAAGDGHVWVSTTNGLHWSPLGRGLPSRLVIDDLLVTATQSMTVFVATAQGLWQLSSGVWTAVRGLPATPITAVVAGAGRIVAATSAEPALYVSSDGGATWNHHAIAGFTGGISTLVQDAQQPSVLVAGDTNGKVGFSIDAGATWTVPVGGVAGTVGTPILALAVIQREALPTDGVPDPHRSDVKWFANAGGHTLRGAFLDFWQALPDAPSLVGYPVSEEFVDRAHGNVPAQYFDRMELLQQHNVVTPAPLGLEQAPSSYVNSTGSYAVDSHFLSFWSSNGGAALFGLPVTPALSQINGDGTGTKYLVQYFRNARLEYHPELSASAKVVQVGSLADQVLQQMGWLQS